MTIEAISGALQITELATARFEQASSASARPASSTQAEAGAGSPDAAADFRETLERVHDQFGKFDASRVGKAADPVEAAKAEMLPSPWKTSAGHGAGQTSGASATTQSDGNQSLRQSFDHAIFVTLVSQVVSGVSQTTSTLIRQQ